MSTQPWYHDGLRFQCLGCGRCCTGQPGYVWVSRREIERLAAALQLEVAELERRFIRCVGRRKSLIELPNGDCIFYDGTSRRCTVYAARPAQCRTWPFWTSNMRTPRAWEVTCAACPGCGRGPTISSEQIAALMAVVRI